MHPVKLISVTETIDTMSPEESIVYMARVSSPQNQDKHDTSYKLLTYLVKHNHWSPFDMVDMTVEIHTSRAIMAQILRHWSFRFQEFSQRYSEVELIDWEHLEARQKHIKGNRQGSGEKSNVGEFHLKQSCLASECAYNHLLQLGIAPESARMALPLAVPTRAYMKGSVRSWMTYFWQRLDPHAQKEHRELAEDIFQIFEEVFPNIAKMVINGKPSYLSYEDMELLDSHKNP
jgi:thymidylate synthase (FAD)